MPSFAEMIARAVSESSSSSSSSSSSASHSPLCTLGTFLVESINEQRLKALTGDGSTFGKHALVRVTHKSTRQGDWDEKMDALVGSVGVTTGFGFKSNAGYSASAVWFGGNDYSAFWVFDDACLVKSSEDESAPELVRSLREFIANTSRTFKVGDEVTLAERDPSFEADDDIAPGARGVVHKVHHVVKSETFVAFVGHGTKLVTARYLKPFVGQVVPATSQDEDDSATEKRTQ